MPDRDALTLAWGDSVLPRLNGLTKAIYGVGRFLPAEDGAAVFALPNDVHRDKCEQKRPEVEAALTAHFGRPIPLRLVTEGDAGGPPPASPTAPTPPAASSVDDDEIVDVHALEDAPTGATGVERLAEAFPGAELVEDT